MIIHRWPAALPFVLIPVALFFALFHPAMLDIGNAGWLIRGTDNGENALGLHAYLHDPHAGMSLRTTLLNAPEGVSLLFTDSNPLIGLLTRPFAALLPVDAQFVGPWYLLCLALHTLFAVLLLRRHAPSPLGLWLGVVLLCALPTLYNRFGQANLFAHWLILWALWLFVDARRAGDVRWWVPLIAIATLVHSYLLVMVGAIWAAAMLERIIRARASERVIVLLHAVVVLGVVAALATWIGARGQYEPAGNYGAFAMPLDALVNPANPQYGTLLPGIPQREGRGYEGFQYLGVGLLLLLPIAGWAMAKFAPKAQDLAVLQRLLWLVPVLVVLTALAISNYPDIAGHKLLRFPLPTVVAPVLDMVRASGRLFWPVAYTIVFVAILAVYRLDRKRATLVLGITLAIQLIDVMGMYQVVRQATDDSVHRSLYVRAVDPRWDRLIRQSRSIAFFPTDVTRDLSLFQEVAWRAVKAGRPVTGVYAARESRETKARLARELDAFSRGDLVPGRLYIITQSAAFPSSAVGRTLVIDGVTVIPPTG